MSNVATPKGQPPTQRQATADHAGLRPLLASLEGARDAKTIAQLVDDLREFLTLHFAGEESPGGFFDSVAPRHASHVARLREEHRAFTERIVRLCGDLDPQREPATSNVLRDVADLVAALRTHEAFEENLLVDSMKTDFGGGN